MSAGEREVLLDQLRSLDDADWGVLTNVRCVAEGVDVPTLDGVAFIDSRRSPIDVVQAVGRAIRRSPEKKLGIVVIPVFIPPHTDDEEVLDASEFRIVWDVVRALRAHDDVLAEQLDTARFELGLRGGATDLPGKITLDLPRSVSPDFARALSARIVQRATSSFAFWFGLLTRHVEEHGTVANVKDTTNIDGYQVGVWAGQRRRARTLGWLSAEQAARLDALPGWSWHPHESKWEHMFALLEDYVEREGNTTVVHSHYEDGLWLGRWVTNQRMKHKGSSAEKLSAAQVARLEALPDWSWERRSSKWEQGFEALASFAERERHTAVPEGHVEAGVNLQSWVTRQRLAHARGQLQRQGVERAARLEALPGWHWTESYTARWERSFAALAKFIDREGHMDVPGDHVEDGVRLRSWIGNQLTIHASGKMPDERIARLDGLALA
jgi:hypothetical protein